MKAIFARLLSWQDFFFFHYIKDFAPLSFLLQYLQLEICSLPLFLHVEYNYFPLTAFKIFSLFFLGHLIKMCFHEIFMCLEFIWAFCVCGFVVFIKCGNFSTCLSFLGSSLRYNLLSSPRKRYIQWILYIHRVVYTLAIIFHFLSTTQPLVTINLLSVSGNFWPFWTFHINGAICGHQLCSVFIHVACVSTNIILNCMNRPHFIYSSVSERLGHFHFLIQNNSAMNICV